MAAKQAMTRLGSRRHDLDHCALPCRVSVRLLLWLLERQLCMLIAIRDNVITVDAKMGLRRQRSA